MTTGLRRAATALLVAAAWLAAGALGAPAGAQAPRIEYLILPEADPLPATPRVVAAVTGLAAAQRPITITLDAARTRVFSGIFYSATLPGDTATFVTRALFPEADSIFLRFTARDRLGGVIAQEVAGFRTAPRLVLRQPIGAFGVTVFDERPTFVWSAAKVEVPPGPWVYDLTVVNANTNQAAFFVAGIVDTTVRPALPLEANTPYRWQVRARLGNADAPAIADTASRVAVSQSTFVIQSASSPTVTLLYQNFPNPFPSPTTDRTCVWFDLRERARVDLVVRDLRGNVVRRLVRGETMGPGSYGRSGEGSASGCVAELSWDGSTEDGRMLPPGVYLLHFRAGSVESVRKMLFQGR